MLLVVAAVLVNADGKILMAQRPEGKQMAGLWEFPGGKVEEGEIPEVALQRELKEELGVEVDLEALMPLTFVSHAYDAFHLFMPLYLCSSWKGEIKALEHKELDWVSLGGLSDLKVPEADAPLIHYLQETPSVLSLSA